MNLTTASHSARVTFPSLFSSTGSKKSLKKVVAASAFVMTSLSFALACLWTSSNGGSGDSLSPAPPGDQPAKYTTPSAATGDVHGADGIPAADHFSAPVFRS